MLGACPALGRAEDDHRVHGTGLVTHLGVGLDVADLAKDLLKQACEARMDGGVRLVVESGDEEVGLVPHALEELGEFLVGDARQDSGVRDFVAVEVQNGQDDAIGLGVDELVRLPRGRQRRGLGLAIAHHRHGEQARIVHHRAECMAQRVAELAALVDGTGGLGREMARDAARVRELAEELLEARLIIRDVGADLTVGAVEQGLRGARGTAVPGPHEEDSVLAVVGDQAVHVAEQEVDARGGAPMAHQAMLDVDAAEIALPPVLASVQSGRMRGLERR